MKISEHCFAITGLFYLPPWTVNAGFVVGNKKTLVIDSSGTYLSAQTIYGYALNVRPENKLLLINTEKHLDHIGGNCFFSEMGVPLYGHPGIMRKNEELQNQLKESCLITKHSERDRECEGIFPFDKTTIVNPNNPITENVEIDLGEEKVEILLTPGHTETNITVFLPKDRVAYVGDLIVSDYRPNLGEANNEKWFKSLEIIKKLNLDVIVPGHGAVIQGKSKINQAISRIREIIELS